MSYEELKASALRIRERLQQFIANLQKPKSDG